MIGETGERKSAVATPDGKSRKKKKKKKNVYIDSVWSRLGDAPRLYPSTYSTFVLFTISMTTRCFGTFIFSLVGRRG